MKTVILIHGYWGKGDNWQAVVEGTLGAGLGEGVLRLVRGEDVQLVIGTGELERDVSPPTSMKVARDLVDASASAPVRNAQKASEVMHHLLDKAVVLLDTMNTNQEVERALAIAEESDADCLVSVHRPEHVRAYFAAGKMARAQGGKVKVLGLSGEHDFDGVGDPVIVEGVHMDDPARDTFAVFADVQLRKRMASEVFGVPKEKLTEYLMARNAAREVAGLAPLDISAKAV